MSPRISISLLGAQTDQRLLTLASEGHERAFEALVQRYRRPLLRYCRRMGLFDGRGEDVLQQAFLQAWLALARGVEVRELRPWLYRIVHNAAVNAMRGPAELHGELTEAVQARAALAGESNLERTIAVREALGDVAELPRMQRQAIFLTAVDGQSHDEVASALGISHGALRGLLYRARATLRSAAAALTPPPLLEWATGGGGAAGPAAERLAELTAGGGMAGFAGVLLKGAVVAVTAGALATGAGVLAGQERAGGSQHRGVSADVTKASVVALSGAGESSLLGNDLSSLKPLAGDRVDRGRRGERGRRRHGRSERGRHRNAGKPGRDGSPGGGEDRGERGLSHTSDTSANGRGGGDSDGVAGDSDDRHGGSAVTGTRGSASGHGREEPLAAGGAKGSTGGDGSGRDGSSSGTSQSERASGNGKAGESGGADASGGSSASRSGGSTSQSEAETVVASGLDNTGSSSAANDESASTDEDVNSGSGGSGGHGGSGSDG
jgi:RNA polymerase sigma factor (sigma-70 family)